MAKIYVDTDEYRDEFYQDVLTILSADDTNDRANEIIDVFDNLPAADVEPVVHAHWIWEHSLLQNYAQCSNCLWSTSVNSNETFDYKYCPHCGAKMDGKF